MSKLVTQNEVITHIEEMSNRAKDDNSFSDYRNCALETIKKLPTKVLAFNDDDGEVVQISVDATTIGEISVAIKLGDKRGASSSVFIMNKDRHLHQGTAIKQQIAMTLSMFATATEAEYILYALRNVIIAASFLQSNPQHALPFDRDPIGFGLEAA